MYQISACSKRIFPIKTEKFQFYVRMVVAEKWYFNVYSPSILREPLIRASYYVILILRS